MSILLLLLTTGLMIANKNDFLSEKFEDFINKYNKTYKTDSNEYNKRFNIFQVNWNLINLNV